MITGRPTKLTPERHKMAVDAYKQGASHNMSSDCIGVSLACLKEWLRRGSEERGKDVDSIYVDFMVEVKKARYDYELSMCKDIDRIGDDGAWQAKCWLLERRNPKSFGRNALEINKMEEMESQLNELKAIIENKFNGGPHNGCIEDE